MYEQACGTKYCTRKKEGKKKVFSQGEKKNILIEVHSTSHHFHLIKFNNFQPLLPKIDLYKNKKTCYVHKGEGNPHPTQPDRNQTNQIKLHPQSITIKSFEILECKI